MIADHTADWTPPNTQCHPHPLLVRPAPPACAFAHAAQRPAAGADELSGFVRERGKWVEQREGDGRGWEEGKLSGGVGGVQTLVQSHRHNPPHPQTRRALISATNPNLPLSLPAQNGASPSSGIRHPSEEVAGSIQPPHCSQPAALNQRPAHGYGRAGQ